jgi:hypothetical protein
MANEFVTRSAGRAAEKVPVLRHVPIVKLIAAAELTLLAREHVLRLDRDERRRVVQLARTARGRARNLTLAERAELALLIAKMEPRLFLGHTVAKLSPVRLPRRVVYGKRRRGSGRRRS